MFKRYERFNSSIWLSMSYKFCKFCQNHFEQLIHLLASFGLFYDFLNPFVEWTKELLKLIAPFIHGSILNLDWQDKLLIPYQQASHRQFMHQLPNCLQNKYIVGYYGLWLTQNAFYFIVVISSIRYLRYWAMWHN